MTLVESWEDLFVRHISHLKTLRSEGRVTVEIVNVFFVFLLAICDYQMKFFFVLRSVGGVGF